MALDCAFRRKTKTESPVQDCSSTSGYEWNEQEISTLSLPGVTFYALDRGFVMMNPKGLKVRYCLGSIPGITTPNKIARPFNNWSRTQNYWWPEVNSRFVVSILNRDNATLFQRFPANIFYLHNMDAGGCKMPVSRATSWKGSLTEKPENSVCERPRNKICGSWIWNIKAKLLKKTRIKLSEQMKSIEDALIRERPGKI